MGMRWKLGTVAVLLVCVVALAISQARGDERHRGPSAVWLGVLIDDESLDGGIYLVAVVPGGPAELAGLERGDVLLKADGRGLVRSEDLERVLSRLPPRPAMFPDDYLTDQPERVLAAEWIREKLLAETRQELPHATAVVVERWQEREDGLLEIDATILVDRASQKRIVIGKQGELLKRVGSAARAELERFLERRLFLRLWVKVREDWRDDETVLDQLGLR